MIIYTRSRVRNKLSRLLLEGRTYLEGGMGSEDFEKTGEANFIRQFYGGTSPVIAATMISPT